MDQLDDHFGNEYGYYHNFQKERVSFSAAKIRIARGKVCNGSEDYIFTIEDSSRLYRD